MPIPERDLARINAESAVRGAIAQLRAALGFVGISASGRVHRLELIELSDLVEQLKQRQGSEINEAMDEFGNLSNFSLYEAFRLKRASGDSYHAKMTLTEANRRRSEHYLASIRNGEPTTNGREVHDNMKSGNFPFVDGWNQMHIEEAREYLGIEHPESN